LLWCMRSQQNLQCTETWFPKLDLIWLRKSDSKSERCKYYTRTIPNATCSTTPYVVMSHLIQILMQILKYRPSYGFKKTGNIRIGSNNLATAMSGNDGVGNLSLTALLARVKAFQWPQSTGL
jgi:hypothetical protein